MKILIAFLAVLFAISLAGTTYAADISGLAWNRSNIATLRSSSKADVVRMFNEQRKKSRVPLSPLTETTIGQFEWADLAGNGKYQLVTTVFTPCAKFVEIDERDASGKIRMVQTIEGFADLKTAIRDLNGNGRDELIIARPLVEYSCVAIATWPAVYRLKNGKYVEASRHFHSFYDDKVLPKLNAAISRDEANGERPNSRRLAPLIMARDKILRVLGRNTTAGLNQAYQWLNTGDPYLLLDAKVTFKDIGGHQGDVKAAELAYTRARCRRFPNMVMCKKLPPGWRSEPAPASERGGSVESNGGGSPSRTVVHREAPPDRSGIAMHPPLPQ